MKRRSHSRQSIENRVAALEAKASAAAVEALQAAQWLYPDSNSQALIDRLVITGLSALVHGKWQPPSPWGTVDRWKLPDSLRGNTPRESL